MKKDLLSLKDLTEEDAFYIFELAEGLKAGVGEFERPLSGKSVGLIFQKPSNRTRLSFEVGIFQLGGNAVYMTGEDIKLGVRESIKDVAKVQSRYLDGIITRTFTHKDAITLAKFAEIPVINGLSDLYHPCQALSDIFTLKEKLGKLTNVTLAYVGDGNNVLNSLMYAAALTGVNIKFSTPPGYEPKKDLVEDAKEVADKNKTDVLYFKDPEDAVKGADCVYTDVWASMGQETERDKRGKDFEEYRINDKLFGKAKKDAIFMHCLPAHRGEEVADSVLDGPNSVVIDQAENRLHVQKAILTVYIGGKKKQ
ncbi:MAG: ornithine carbamoyltransferase [Candidatus Omnitrophica bacterium]|nr:ornithine carbamoyltransferase [Candidatus Omnitrophota bacterium]MBU4488924.1 ornithine carbamoyltransferase [Candidatus Omnitrophota bacterium]MCG2705320.1 ornithine carbamoyltransferase [Candidatus Omnitrophota bacterium]